MPIREALALLGIGTLGGVWAVALGNKRVQRPQRVAMLDARTQMQVQLDALRARTGMVSRHVELTPQAHGLIDEVVEHQVLIDAILARAAGPEDVEELTDDVSEAFVRIEEAGVLIGIHLPADDRFFGLCRIDPEHGPSGEDVVDDRPVCDACATAARDGRPPARRQVTQNGRPIVFDELPPASQL